MYNHGLYKESNMGARSKGTSMCISISHIYMYMFDYLKLWSYIMNDTNVIVDEENKPITT